MALQAKQFTPRLTFDSKATVPIGTKVSNGVDLHGTVAVGFLFPADMTSTSMTIHGSIDGVNFFECMNDTGLEMEVAFKANGYTCLSPDDLSSIRFIQLHMLSDEVAEREIIIISRGAL